MQTLQDVDPSILFSQYSYSSSSSPSLVQHFESLATQLASRYELTGRLCIDIGCNDGVFLKPLRRFGARVLGVDPSDVAEKSGLRHRFPVISKYLTPDVALDIKQSFGAPRIVSACNVLAHVEDPHVLVQSIAALSVPETIVLIEVHYQGALLEGFQYDTVYHEHTCYYSLKSIERLLRDHGLRVSRVEFIPNHGGSIRVFASLGSTRFSEISKESQRESPPDLVMFADGARSMRRALIEEVQYRVRQSNTIYGYGASGRGTILLNWCGFTPDEVYLVIDQSPLRVGKIIPGVGIPVRHVDEVGPEGGTGRFVLKEPDIYLLTAWNYGRSIVSQHPFYQGRWLTPLPIVRYL